MEQAKERPVLMFIFGGSGDLARRKLVPALYNLYDNSVLPENFCIVGIGRTPFQSDEDYREELLKSFKEFPRHKNVSNKPWPEFAQHLSYLKSDPNEEITYQRITGMILEKKEKWHTAPTVIFYLAVAPWLASVIAQQLAAMKVGLNLDSFRIVFEKPFGHDLESAQALNHSLTRLFNEKEIYRIDHYLGKDAVRDITLFRFKGKTLEPFWSKDFIDRVEILASETVGIGERGGYYEESGALRDMVQNHLLQLLSLIGMEVPPSFGSDAVRDRKVETLSAIRIMSPEEVVAMVTRGQYGEGVVKGERVIAYREEKNVDPASSVETFVAATFFVDTERWSGVPFSLCTGKRLDKKETSITIYFKQLPGDLFSNETAGQQFSAKLVFHIYPYKAISLQTDNSSTNLEKLFDAKTGAYEEHESYERLLSAIVEGNQTMFLRSDEIEAAWKVVMPILNTWKENNLLPISFYPAGTLCLVKNGASIEYQSIDSSAKKDYDLQKTI